MEVIPMDKSSNTKTNNKVAMKKKIIVIICSLMAILMVFGTLLPAFAAERDGTAGYGPTADQKWVQENGNWRYKLENNTYARSAWIKYITDTGEERWYVDANGNMVYNDWAKVDGKWYTLGADGKVTNKTWIKTAEGNWIWGAGDGKLTNGWKSIEGKDYHFNSKGVMETGWLQDGSDWYFLNDSGERVYGWVKVDNNWYYLDSSNSGKMVTGEKTIDGKKYLFDYVSGAMR